MSDEVTTQTIPAMALGFIPTETIRDVGQAGISLSEHVATAVLRALAKEIPAVDAAIFGPDDKPTPEGERIVYAMFEAAALAYARANVGSFSTYLRHREQAAQPPEPPGAHSTQ
jgi:hypothetical protein